VCVSKALAAGMPLSAVAGPTKYLSKLGAMEVQVSTTFGGEMLSLAVCEATLKEYRKGGYIEHLSGLGARLRNGVNAHAEKTGSPLRVLGYDAIPFFLFDKNPAEHAKRMQPFQAGMARRGILLRRDVNFISAVHTPEQIDYTIEMAGEVLQSLARSA
jgi:aminotransferase MxcL